ncbi:MAG: alpha/beta hydrolase [Gemmatimonadota bacterium]
MDAVAPPKSTNVRIEAPAAITTTVRLLHRVSPALARRFARRLFFTPPRRRPSARTLGLLATGEPFVLHVRGGRVRGWRWGSGPAVYLLHGWGGRAASLAPFVGPLVERGFSAVAFDAPGHGSSDGRISTLLHFAAALRAAAAEVAPAHALVAHSMGAAAAAYALRGGLAAERAVFVGAAADPFRFHDTFMEAVGLPRTEWGVSVREIEAWLGIPAGDVSVPASAPLMTVPLLAFHDRGDPEVPCSESEEIVAAWPGARLVATTGLGHREILRDPEVIRAAVDFLAGGAVREPERLRA